MAFGTLLPARIGASGGVTTNVSTASALAVALATVANGSIINITASFDGGGATFNITRAAGAGNPITITRSPGVLVTNSFWYVTGSYLRFLDLDLGSSPIDGIKFTDGAHHCEVDHCHVHNATRMGINVQPGSSDPTDIQIWNCEIHNNGTSSTLDHGIYFAKARGNCVVANNLAYANKAYNMQFYPDSPNIIVTCNTLDGGLTRGGMVVGSETGLDDNVIVVGVIGSNAAWYCVDVYDPVSGDTGNNAYDCIGFGNGLGDYHAGGGFTYTNCGHANPQFVNRGGADYHLQAGSPATGKIQPARYGYVPPTDRDGLTRLTADAGCYRAPALGAAHRKVLLTLPTVAGPITVTGLGFQPKAAILWCTRQTVEGFTADMSMSIGFAASPTQRYTACVRCSDGNNPASGSTSTRIQKSNRCLIASMTGGGTVEMELDLTSFDSDGATFALTTPSGSPQPYEVHVLFLGGNDLTAAAVGVSNPTSGAGDKQTTGVGFTPDCVLLAEIGDNTVGSAFSDAALAVGAFTRTQQVAAAFRSRNGLSPTDVANYQRSDKAYVGISLGAGSVDHEATFKTMDADGWTLNHTIQLAGRAYGYLALKGGQYDLRALAQPAVTGNQAVAGLALAPKALFLLSTGKTASAALDQTQGKIAVGGTDGTQQGCTWGAVTDNVTIAEAKQALVSDKVIRHAVSPATVSAEATAVSLDATGYTLNWPTVDATARELLVIALGGAPGVLPANTVAPVASVVGGAAAVIGSLVQVDTGTWTGDTPFTYAYEWERETGVATGVYTPITGEISATYLAAIADVGLRLRAQVTATNGAGATSAVSNAVGPVTNPSSGSGTSSGSAGRRLRRRGWPGWIVPN